MVPRLSQCTPKTHECLPTRKVRPRRIKRPNTGSLSQSFETTKPAHLHWNTPKQKESIHDPFWSLEPPWFRTHGPPWHVRGHEPPWHVRMHEPAMTCEKTWTTMTCKKTWTTMTCKKTWTTMTCKKTWTTVTCKSLGHKPKVFNPKKHQLYINFWSKQ